VFKKEFSYTNNGEPRNLTAERFDAELTDEETGRQVSGVGLWLIDGDAPDDVGALAFVDDGPDVHVVLELLTPFDRDNLGMRMPREAAVQWLEDTLAALKAAPAQKEAA
jgi:hypothetical protein